MKKPAKPPTNGGKGEPTAIYFLDVNTPEEIEKLADEFYALAEMEELAEKKKRRKSKTSNPIVKPAGTELTFLGFKDVTSEAEILKIADEFLEAGRLDKLMAEKSKNRKKAKTAKTKP